MAAFAPALPPHNQAEFDKWFPSLKRQFPDAAKRQAPPKLRVLCFPNAGSAEDTYTSHSKPKPNMKQNVLVQWCTDNGAALYAAQPPGRGRRVAEPMFDTAAKVAAAAFAACGSEFFGDAVPYVVVGHSVGTWVSYEFLKLVYAQGLKPPVTQVVSAFPQPDIPEADRPWEKSRKMAVEAFKAECGMWDVNPMVFKPGLWEQFEGVMRNDFLMYDEYKFDAAQFRKFTHPIDSFHARDDKRIKVPHLEGWAKFTSAAYTHHGPSVAGNHLFLYTNPIRDTWMAGIVKAIEAARLLPAPQPWPAKAPVDAAALLKRGIARWAFDISKWTPTEDEWEFCCGCVLPEEATKIKRFVREPDRKLALGSRLLQRRLCATVLGMPDLEVPIERSKAGKPYLGASARTQRPDLPNFNFNVSHHADFVAIASEPEVVVGLDLMKGNEMPHGSRGIEDFFSSFTKSFTASEWQQIRSAKTEAATYEQFYRFWCMKESLIKADGRGLGFELERMSFTYKGPGGILADEVTVEIDGRAPPDPWTFKLSKLEEGSTHWACCSRAPPQATYHEYKDTLQLDHLPRAAVEAAQDTDHPPFDVLDISDLLPPGKRDEFLARFEGGDEDDEDGFW